MLKKKIAKNHQNHIVSFETPKPTIQSSFLMINYLIIHLLKIMRENHYCIIAKKQTWWLRDKALICDPAILALKKHAWTPPAVLRCCCTSTYHSLSNLISQMSFLIENFVSKYCFLRVIFVLDNTVDRWGTHKTLILKMQLFIKLNLNLVWHRMDLLSPVPFPPIKESK